MPNRVCFVLQPDLLDLGVGQLGAVVVLTDALGTRLVEREEAFRRKGVADFDELSGGPSGHLVLRKCIHRIHLFSYVLGYTHIYTVYYYLYPYIGKKVDTVDTSLF